LLFAFALALVSTFVGAAQDGEQCRSQHQSASLLGSRPQILLFGDSITEYSTGSFGWATELSQLFSRKADIIIRGYSGYNSAIAWSMLQQSTGIFPHGDGDRTLMLVFFGANDAAAPDYHMHVPVDEYGDNLRSIVRRSKETMPGITVVLVSPPPIDEEKLMQFDWYAGRSTELAGAYAEEAARAARDEGAIFLDIHTLMVNKPDWKPFLSDGLHLSPIGQAFVVEELLRVLLTHAPSWIPDRMPMHYPWHIDTFKTLDHEGQRDAKICPWPDADSKQYCFHRMAK